MDRFWMGRWEREVSWLNQCRMAVVYDESRTLAARVLAEARDVRVGVSVHRERGRGVSRGVPSMYGGVPSMHGNTKGRRRRRRRGQEEEQQEGRVGLGGRDYNL